MFVRTPIAGAVAEAAARVGRMPAAERDRWPLWLPVWFGAGVAFYFALASEPPGWLGPSGAAAAALLAWFWRRRPGLALPALLLGVASAGLATAQFQSARIAAPVLEKRIGPIGLTGRVASVEPLPSGHRVFLDSIASPGLPGERTPERVRLKAYAIPAALRPGDPVSVRAVLSPPPGPAIPGGYDFARRAFFERLGAVGFTVAPLRILDRGRADGFSWRIALAGLRARVTARIHAALDPPTSAVAAALMTGQRKSIPADVLAAMRDAGLAHLLAISGLHIGLIAGILFFGLRFALAAAEPLALRHPIKKWAAAGALAGAFAYLLLSGATIPTQRAFLMLAVVLAAVFLDRAAISMRPVACAAMLVLLLAPESLVGPSFQMSFAAVIALVAAHEIIAPRLALWRADGGRIRRVGAYFVGVAATTLIAGLATAPFAIHHFNRLALYGLAANLVAVPVTGLWIMPWAVCAFALMPFGLEPLALAPMGWGIDAVVAVARVVAGWPGAVAVLPALSPAGFALVVLGGLWLCLWRTGWRLAGAAAIVGGLAMLVSARTPDVLVNERGSLIAIRGEDGRLALSSTRRARYEGKAWLRHFGQRAAAPWPGEGGSGGGRFACDGLGCILRVHGSTVAIARSTAALDEDCRIARLLIGVVPVPRRRCPGPVRVIDRFDLWRHGAHAIWIDRDRIRVRSVGEARGVRPWTPRRAAPTAGQYRR